MIGILRLLSILALYVLASTAQADVLITNVIKDVPPSRLKYIGKPDIQATHFRTVTINTQRLRQQLKVVPRRGKLVAGKNVLLDLPLPDGSMHRFYVMENDTMSPALAAKFPQIKTYNGYGVGQSKEFVKFDLTPNGFHAMILSPGKTAVFIDPYNRVKTDYYMVYKKDDFITNKKMSCSLSTSSSSFKYFNKHANSIDFSSCFLRTYRLAVAATIEYTAYYGNVILTALAAQVTTINRVNAVYETDIGVTLEIIPNNDNIVFKDTYPAIPFIPYTSGDGDAMVVENQNNIDIVIQSGNYDIGHVFDRNVESAGLAGVGVVCNNLDKAKAVTGSANPIGDPFDIDFVAHEIGHQFNAEHTQNNACNRNAATAVEPGSGSTIMGYAGICAPNVQLNSDAYFNGINLEEIGTFVTLGGGATCGSTQVIPAAPVVAVPANITIPISTPFALTGSAAGPGSAAFTYAWEQQDNAISVQPPAANSTNGPNFRSMTPTLSATRTFPSLTALANNGPYTWEVLPSVGRTMNFRVSVRGNTPGGSCNAYEDMTVTVDAAAGPFILTYPTAANVQWPGNSQQTITWNVANTNNAPVSAATVDIVMSTDGGLTYPTTLVAGVPNTGSSVITVPAIDNLLVRVMVRSSNGAFFSVSSNNLAIYTNTTPVIPPTLKIADRNPLQLTTAFVYVTSMGNVTTNDTFTANGLSNVNVALDTAYNRFVISGINTPHAVSNVSITITHGGVFTATTNAITIPDIL